MNKAEVQTKIASLADNDDVVFRTKAEDTEFINNYFKTTLDEFDNAFFEITGVKRSTPGLKSIDFARNTLKDLKAKADLAPTLAESERTLKSEISELQKQIREGAHDKGILKELDNAKKELEDVKTRHQKLQNNLTEKEQAFQNFRVSAEIEKAMAAFKIKETIPDAVKTTYLETKKAELLKSAEFDENGKLVFKDANGVVMKNDTTMAPKTINEILKDILTPIVDEGIHLPGPGADKNKPASNTGASYIPGASDKIENLSEDVQRNTGFKRGTPEYMKAFKEGNDILKARK